MIIQTVQKSESGSSVGELTANMLSHEEGSSVAARVDTVAQSQIQKQTFWHFYRNAEKEQSAHWTMCVGSILGGGVMAAGSMASAFYLPSSLVGLGALASGVLGLGSIATIHGFFSYLEWRGLVCPMPDDPW